MFFPILHLPSSAAIADEFCAALTTSVIVFVITTTMMSKAFRKPVTTKIRMSFICCFVEQVRTVLARLFTHHLSLHSVSLNNV